MGGGGGGGGMIWGEEIKPNNKLNGFFHAQ